MSTLHDFYGFKHIAGSYKQCFRAAYAECLRRRLM